tara:strand:- start:40438 stop:42111 length:1674 start_codon:yes stop_codon:yes gene_type:complete
VLLRPFYIQNQLAQYNPLPKFFALLMASMPLGVFCQEIDIKTTVNATGYIYETQIGDEEATQSDSILVKPSVVGSYSSKRLKASLSANHSIIKKNTDSSTGIITDTDTDTDTDTSNDTQNYTDLRYSSTLSFIENVLLLTLNGTQSYRNVSQQQNYFSDQVLASEGLTKTSSNSAQLSFASPNPLYLGFSLQGNYSKTKTDLSQESVSGLDNDNVGVVARLYQGKNVRAVNFDISGQYNDTSRTNSQNFKSTRVQGNIGFPIVNKLDFLVTGSLEEYDSGNTEIANRTNIDTSSYGAGLKWSPSNERNISLTYNQLEESDEKTKFVGLDLAWAFTSRTALNFEYGKRFSGDSYKFDFRHSLKSLRTSISYSEDVTTYSRLGASSTNITGIFVCEFGSTELTDCFQPPSVDYQLQAGEEFRATYEIDTDITEEVLFRKTGSATIGYDKRRVKISINANYSQTEYLESERINTNRSLGFNFNYALGRKTNISFASTLTENQYSEVEEADTIITTSLNFTRDLAQQLKLSIGLRLLDRQSDTLERDGSDKRLTVGLNYTF